MHHIIPFKQKFQNPIVNFNSRACKISVSESVVPSMVWILHNWILSSPPSLHDIIRMKANKKPALKCIHKFKSWQVKNHWVKKRMSLKLELTIGFSENVSIWDVWCAGSSPIWLALQGPIITYHKIVEPCRVRASSLRSLGALLSSSSSQKNLPITLCRGKGERRGGKQSCARGVVTKQWIVMLS